MPAAPCSNIDSQLILREAIKLIAQANIRSLVNACEHGREQKQRPRCIIHRSAVITVAVQATV